MGEEAQAAEAEGLVEGDEGEVVLSATDMGDGTVQVMVAHTAPTE